MIKKYLFGMMLCVLAGCQTQTVESFDADRELDYCAGQVTKALEAIHEADGDYDFTMMPRNILEGETVWSRRKASEQEWCSGFWPGVLWMTLESEELRMKNEEFLTPKGMSVAREATAIPVDSLKKVAEGYTEALAFLEKQPAYDHDLGFIVINSFLKGYEQTQNETYKRIALACADTLATLFNSKVGTILSWPRHVKDYGGHNTIMDNMMNLELLFWASQENEELREKNEKLYNIAVRHAETTMKNHFREDGSCYHVAVYDTLDGHFIKGVTHQGYADSSMWSRGQSWAIYGYTMVYRYTKDQRFLDFAQKVTDIYLKRLKKTSDDMVPIWDMDAPVGQREKDVSAACVVASALLELCKYVDAEKGKTYREAAISMLRDLSTERYQSRSKNVSFLMHSTGHHPAGSEIDASIIYADYYYLEALCKLKAIELALNGQGAAKGI